MMKRLRRVTLALSMASSASMIQAQPGSLDLSFASDPGTNDQVTSVTLQGDGKALLTGYFTTYNGSLASGIIRLNDDGSRDLSFQLAGSGLSGVAYGSLQQPDGKIIVYGDIFQYNGIYTWRIARLNSDGSLDQGFDPGFVSGSVYDVALQSDGKILAVGLIGIKRYNSNGSIDASFQTGSGFDSPFVTKVEVQPDGKILVGGDFTEYDGLQANHVVRLNTNGTLDGSFSSADGFNTTDYVVSDMALQPDGKILIAGDFESYNGTTRPILARLNADGSIDATFVTPLVGGAIYSVGLRQDGKMMIGSSGFSGLPPNVYHVARLLPNGGLDPSYFPAASFSGFNLIRSIALRSDGKIYVGGLFTGYAGVTRGNVLRLNDCTSTTYYADTDGDNYGDPNTFQSACTQPPGFVLNSSDCDDTDPLILGPTQWWLDADGDGWGAPFTLVLTCTQPVGYVSNDIDCDDTNPLITPTEWCVDVDSDGHGDPSNTIWACDQPLGTVPVGGLCDDCVDEDASIYPGASCNDGDICTGNDIYTATCGCVGVYQDTDADGVCDGEDDCPFVFGEIGSPCDDGDAYTIQDALNASCTCAGRLTQLTDAPDPIVTCGMMNMEFGSTMLYAFEVAGANRYRFNFVNIPGQVAYNRNITYNTRSFLLTQWATLPFKAGRTYMGRVQVSFDGGATYGPWGPTCNVRMGYPPQMPLESANNSLSGPKLHHWPNPNNGSELNIRILDLERVDGPLFVELMDQLGRVVQQRAVLLAEPASTATMELPENISPGIYMVRATMGEQRFIEQLVVE